jgi:hypothetical protein
MVVPCENDQGTLAGTLQINQLGTDPARCETVSAEDASFSVAEFPAACLAIRMKTMGELKLELPQYFDEYAWEVESKGWLQGVIATIDGRRYLLTFYDPTRLSQDIEEQLVREQCFFEPNLIVVRSVTREYIEASVAAIVATGGQAALAPEDAPSLIQHSLAAGLVQVVQEGREGGVDETGPNCS